MLREVSSNESILSLGGMRRLSTNLQVEEEVERVRQAVREVKGEEKGEINCEGEPHTS